MGLARIRPGMDHYQTTTKKHTHRTELSHRLVEQGFVRMAIRKRKVTSDLMKKTNNKAVCREREGELR